MEREAMSQAEWQVMRVIWAQSEVTSSGLVEVLAPAFNWQPATVKTLLVRLRHKGLIEMVKTEGKPIYRALIDEATQLQQSLKQLTAQICQTKQVELVKMLLEEGEFSQSDLQELIDVAEAKRLIAPEILMCNCLPSQCTCGQHGGVCHG